MGGKGMNTQDSKGGSNTTNPMPEEGEEQQHPGTKLGTKQAQSSATTTRPTSPPPLSNCRSGDSEGKLIHIRNQKAYKAHAQLRRPLPRTPGTRRRTGATTKSPHYHEKQEPTRGGGNQEQGENPGPPNPIRRARSQASALLASISSETQAAAEYAPNAEDLGHQHRADYAAEALELITQAMGLANDVGVPGVVDYLAAAGARLSQLHVSRARGTDRGGKALPTPNAFEIAALTVGIMVCCTGIVATTCNSGEQGWQTQFAATSSGPTHIRMFYSRLALSNSRGAGLSLPESRRKMVEVPQGWEGGRQCCARLPFGVRSGGRLVGVSVVQVSTVGRTRPTAELMLAACAVIYCCHVRPLLPSGSEPSADGGVELPFQIGGPQTCTLYHIIPSHWQFRTSRCKLFKQDWGEIADPLGPSQVSSLHWAHIDPRPTLTRNPSFFSIHLLEASNGKNSRGLEGPNSRSHKSLTSPGETKHPCPSPLFHVEPARKPGTECCVCHLVAALPSVFVVCLLRPWDTMAIQSFRGIFPL